MTEYHLIKFNLSPGQLAKARSALKHERSLTLRIAAKDMGHGNSHLSLTHHQAELASKKHKAGLGSQFAISHAALKHTHIHGNGFGDWIKGKAKQAAAYGIRKGADALANYVGGGIIDYNKSPSQAFADTFKGKGVKKRKIKGKGFFGNLAGGAARGLGNLIGSAIEGAGVKKCACGRGIKVKPKVM